MKGVFRILILAPLVGICALPYVLLKVYNPYINNDVYDTIIFYHFFRVIVPGMLLGFYMVTAYDKVVFWAYDKFGWNED